MKRPSGEENKEHLHITVPAIVIWAWEPLLDFIRAALRGVGHHYPGPPQTGAHTLCPSNGSLLFTPFPREQNHSGLCLKGSNFEHWVLGRLNKKFRSWLSTRHMHWKKMTLKAEDRKEKMIYLFSLFPLFLLSQTLVRACPPGVPRRREQAGISALGLFPFYPKSGLWKLPDPNNPI